MGFGPAYGGGLDSRVSALETSATHTDAVHVDTTSTDLATALAGATFDPVEKTWTFGTKVLGEGDVLILNASTNQDDERSWIVNGTLAGTADFSKLGTDIDTVIQSYINNLIGGASAGYDTLGEIETVVTGIDARLVTAEADIVQAKADILLRPEFKTATAATWTDNGDGTYTASVANPYNNTEVQIQVQSDAGSGSWHYHFSPEYDMDITASSVSISTTSTTLSGHAVKFLMSAIVVV